MPESAARPTDPFCLDPTDGEEAPAEVEDSLDLEAYLDLDESPEIRELMRRMRGEAEEAAGPKQEGPVPAPRDPQRSTPAGSHRASPAAAPGGAPKDAGRITPPRGHRASPAAAPAAAPGQEAPGGAPGDARRFTPSRAHEPSPTASLTAVARALGEVRLQARQLVVACPRCEGRASIVISGERFKCFGCDAAGDAVALASLLTGWDATRVAAWLAAAGEGTAVDDAAGRRPWRLSIFAR